jgi:citrate lyase synthetase
MILRLEIAKQATEQEIDELYVGDELYAKATDIYNEYLTAEWHKQKRKSADAQPASSSAAVEDDEEELAF